MVTNRSMLRSLLTIQTILASVLVLGYSILLIVYFTKGLEESNYYDMYREVQHFSKVYEQNKQERLPHSIQYDGYLGWKQLPTSMQKKFPRLQHITQIEFRQFKIERSEVGISPPKRLVYVVAQPLFDGKTFYLVRNIVVEEYVGIVSDRIEKIMALTIPIGLVFISLFLIPIYIMFKRFTRPMQKLEEWSADLTLENTKEQVPDFRFIELNRIANRQNSAFKKIGDLLESEHDFFRHASHEFRTPISVIKNGAELLKRIVTKKQSITTIDRLSRAAVNMQHMSETLLWLSRDDSRILEKSNADVTLIIHEIIEDNQYLLESKQVSLNIELTNIPIMVAATPCRIVLNNIVRNAFQYTYNGDIHISFKDNCFSTRNTNVIDVDNEFDEANSDDYGYGFGLKLVQKIMKKTKWIYQNNEIPGGRHVTVLFKDND